MLARDSEVRHGSAGPRGSMTPCLARTWFRPASADCRPASVPDRPGRAPSRPAPARGPLAVARGLPIPARRPLAVARGLPIPARRLLAVARELPIPARRLLALARGLPIPVPGPPALVRGLPTPVPGPSILVRGLRTLVQGPRIPARRPPREVRPWPGCRPRAQLDRPRAWCCRAGGRPCRVQSRYSCCPPISPDRPCCGSCSMRIPSWPVPPRPGWRRCAPS